MLKVNWSKGKSWITTLHTLDLVMLGLAGLLLLLCVCLVPLDGRGWLAMLAGLVGLAVLTYQALSGDTDGNR
jgi:hypothetical protein